MFSTRKTTDLSRLEEQPLLIPRRGNYKLHNLLLFFYMSTKNKEETVYTNRRAGWRPDRKGARAGREKWGQNKMAAVWDGLFLSLQSRSEDRRLTRKANSIYGHRLFVIELVALQITCQYLRGGEGEGGDLNSEAIFVTVRILSHTSSFFCKIIITKTLISLVHFDVFCHRCKDSVSCDF